MPPVIGDAVIIKNFRGSPVFAWGCYGKAIIIQMDNISTMPQGKPMKIKTLLCASLLALTGCATPTTLVPTDGSRADGTIELSYEHGEFEKPVIDLEQARQSAKERCKAWGYDDAEAFGGQRTSCAMPGGFAGCARYIVTVRYQCLGNLS